MGASCGRHDPSKRHLWIRFLSAKKQTVTWVQYENSVFINCPFDPDYLPLLRPILFCVIELGLEPRISSERLNSGEPRVEKIVELIGSSKYCIHDISRIQAKKKGELYRLNMPFELGLDVGCRIYGGTQYAAKKCLILEAERYRYQAAISDLSNSDIGVHGNDPREALAEVRNWLVNEAGLNADGPTALWGRFNDFMAENYDDLKARGFSGEDVEKLPVSELLPCMKRWVGQNPAQPGAKS